MQGKMKYMNVQQQQQYTALQFVVFIPLPAILLYASVFVSVDHFLWYTYMYICIYTCIFIIYIFIWGFCSIVISVFVYAGHGDFRTENLSLGELFYFPPSGENKRNLSLSKPIVQRSRERHEKGEVRLDYASNTSSFFQWCVMSILQSPTILGISENVLVGFKVSLNTLPDSSPNHFTSDKLMSNTDFHIYDAHTAARWGGEMGVNRWKTCTLIKVSHKNYTPPSGFSQFATTTKKGLKPQD